MTATTTSPVRVAPDWEEIARQQRERADALAAEVQALRSAAGGDLLEAHAWLQRKADRQRKALDRLNRKVRTQRFRLRLLAALGRDVTRDEYLAARGPAWLDGPDGFPVENPINDRENFA